MGALNNEIRYRNQELFNDLTVSFTSEPQLEDMYYENDLSRMQKMMTLLGVTLQRVKTTLVFRKMNQNWSI